MIISLASIVMWATAALLCFLILCYLIVRFRFVASSLHSGGSFLAKGTRGIGGFCTRAAKGFFDGACFLTMPWQKTAWEKYTLWSLVGLILYRGVNLAIFLSVIFGNLPLDIQRSAVLYFLDDQNKTPMHLPTSSAT
jgi:hypothetical protein